MAAQTYQWTRFFYARGGKIRFQDNGFIYDIESAYGNLANPDVKRFEDIISFPCLILIGEPGIGKSVTLSQGYDRIKTQFEPDGHCVEWFDLRGYGNENRLNRDLFETQRFKDWLSGSHELHLFLDSFDECLIHLKTLTPLLLDKIKVLPIQRLKLRIACRTSELPLALENELQRMWGQENIGIFKLTPLRRNDVITALEANGLNSEAFLSEIIERNAVAFATNPVTLSFFINVFRNEGTLPTNTRELFFEGCKCLCSEPNENIRDITRDERLGPTEKFIIASRIAALMLLSNKDIISYGRFDLGLQESELHLDQLLGGVEYFNGVETQVDRTTILNTFNTGLFISRGPEKIGWAHQSYVDFLTAYYLRHNNVPIEKIINLLIHPSVSERRVIPQLHGLAIWLSLFYSEIFDEIIEIEPELILKGSFDSLENHIKERIMHQLLVKIEEGVSINVLTQHIHHFSKLRFPDMASLLHEYIVNPQKTAEIRKISILIAEFCDITELESEILLIAHDQSENYEIRKYAAFYLSKIGSEDAKKTLVRFIRGETGPDPELDLLGIGLTTAWPRYISAEELFSSLPSPHIDPVGGYYHIFLSNNLVTHLNNDSLPIALRWVASIYDLESVPFFFELLSDDIMINSLDGLDDPRVLDSFALAALAKLSKYKPIVSRRLDRNIPEILVENSNLRHDIVSQMSNYIETYQRVSYQLVRSEIPLVNSEDIEWLIEKLNQSVSMELKNFWADLIQYSYLRDNIHHFNLIYYAVQENPEISEKFLWLLGPIDLDSDSANQMREYYENEQRLRTDQQETIISPSPYEATINKLVEIESGNSDAWIDLNHYMRFEPTGRSTSNIFEYDLQQLPVWELLNEEEKQRVYISAEKYIHEGDPRTSEWLGTNEFRFSALAGFRAFTLLIDKRDNLLDEIPLSVIQKWAPTIIGIPDDTRSFDLKKDLIKKIYPLAHERINETLSILIDYENERDFLYSLNYFRGINESSLNSMLLRKTDEIELTPKSMGEIIRFLLENQYPPVEEYIISIINVVEPADECDLQKRIIAASHYVTYSSSGWEYCWPLIQTNIDFGKRLIESVVPSHYYLEFWKHISLDQVYDMIHWIMVQYPPEEDPEHSSGVAYLVEPHDEIVRLRNQLFSYLRNHGSLESSQILHRLASEFQQYPTLKIIALEASAIMRYRTWIPLSPNSIIRIIKENQTRLIQNGIHLLNVLKESVIRLEQVLQGESPASRDLWDKISKNKYRPVDENAFSDYVKRYFDGDLLERGIIANREVEIRRGEGSGIGERTDIHIDCILLDNGEIVDTITAIVEVKGCWHSQLGTAMGTQLVERYLKDNQCNHGFYLVGWFDCDQWDARDRRRRSCQRTSIESLSDHFATQSSELAEQHHVVLDYQIVNAALR